MPQHMTPLAPEARHRFPDRRIRLVRVLVYVFRVRQLCDRVAIHQMDLRVRQRA